MSSFDPARQIGYNFTFERFNEDNELDFKISAANIRWVEKDSHYRLTSYQKRKLVNDTAMVDTKRRLDTLFTFDIGDLTPVSYVAETKNFFELNRFIEDQKQKGASNINTYVLVKYKRWALPISAFILTIIAVAVASVKRRGGMGVNLAFGIVVAFIFIFFDKVFGTLAEHPVFTLASGACPEFAFWYLGSGTVAKRRSGNRSRTNRIFIFAKSNETHSIMEYLDFELPIKELEEQLDKCMVIGEESDVDVTETCKQIEKKLTDTRKDIYKNLSAWQRVQLSRHPNRPYTLDYINSICGDTFLELHGDRNVKDDKAMIGGLGKIDDQSYMFIGQQKGYNTKTRQYRNFGMANPEGYRKALRLMKSAEKFGIPVVCLIDTPGAYPGIEAEERGQGEAIARNILEMTRLKVPIIVVIIGEGASGGALGIGVGDHVLMLENTWYSVISPESCSSILWRSWEYKEQAAEALKLTATDMKKLKLIDEIVREPIGGAHADREKTFDIVKNKIKPSYKNWKSYPQKNWWNSEWTSMLKWAFLMANTCFYNVRQKSRGSFLRFFLVINTKS